MSVGLLAVPLQYGLYVVGYLSKWFVFALMFKFRSVGRPTIGYNKKVFYAKSKQKNKDLRID